MTLNLTQTVAYAIACWMNQYTQKEGLALTKMTLGIEIFLINVSKLAIVYVLAISLGVLWQTLAINLSFMLVKRYSFGVHALSSRLCTLICCITFVFVPWVATIQGLGINHVITVVAFSTVIIILYKYAPADTKARPLVGTQARSHLKKKAVVCGLILMLLAILVSSDSIRLMLVLGAAFQSIALLPITYKLLKRSEKNYEKYEHAK